MKTPHKHAALIKAWANGVFIQERYKEDKTWFPFRGVWTDDAEWEYRVKPEPKDDVVEYIFAERIFCVLRLYQVIPSNLKLTFDGETGKLKAAEVFA